MNLIASLLSGLYSWFGKTKNGIKYVWGTQMQKIANNGVTGLPEKIATVYTCCRTLSLNLSRMPLSVFIDNDSGRTELKKHRLTYFLKFQPNQYQNAQQFWSTIEYHRNYFGNAFVRIYKDSRRYIKSMEILHPSLLKDYIFDEGELFYIFVNPITQREEIVSAYEILHFRGMSEDGIIGLSPLVAIERQTNINERITSTLDHFYENNALSPFAVETEVPNIGPGSGPAVKSIQESRESFETNYAGPDNSGKPIFVPIGSKIKNLAMQFADAKMIETLKTTREDISAAYGIPLFMIDGSAEKLDVEQLTTLFKNNTMGPIVAIYMAEINGKLLTRKELESGVSVMFDVFSLIGMDYKTLVTAIKDQVVNGLMAPDEGAKKLGNKPIPGKWAKLHYMQAQYVPLEEYEKYNKLIKDDPSLKTIE